MQWSSPQMVRFVASTRMTQSYLWLGTTDKFGGSAWLKHTHACGEEAWDVDEYLLSKQFF